MPDVEEAQAALRVSGSTSIITINAQSTRLIELKRWLEPLRDLKVAISSAVEAAAGKQHNTDVQNLSAHFSKVTINHIPHLVEFFKYRTEDFGPRLLSEAPGHLCFNHGLLSVHSKVIINIVNVFHVKWWWVFLTISCDHVTEGKIEGLQLLVEVWNLELGLTKWTISTPDYISHL